VALIEVADVGERRAVMRAFPAEVPGGVPFFIELGLVATGSADEFEAAAERVSVFEIVTIPS
jgi:hypothetical protein